MILRFYLVIFIQVLFFGLSSLRSYILQIGKTSQVRSEKDDNHPNANSLKLLKISPSPIISFIAIICFWTVHNSIYFLPILCCSPSGTHPKTFYPNWTIYQEWKFNKIKILSYFSLPNWNWWEKSEILKGNRIENLAYLGQFFPWKIFRVSQKHIIFKLKFGENSPVDSALLQGETCYKIIIIIMFKLLFSSRYGICNWSVRCWKWHLFRFKASACRSDQAWDTFQQFKWIQIQVHFAAHQCNTC